MTSTDKIDLTIWGTGVWGTKAYGYFTYAKETYGIGFKIVRFIDSDKVKQGKKRFKGLDVADPDKMDWNKCDYLVVAISNNVTIKNYLRDNNINIKRLIFFDQETIAKDIPVLQYMNLIWDANDFASKFEDYAFWRPAIIHSIYEKYEKGIANKVFNKISKYKPEWIEYGKIIYCGEDIHKAEKLLCFQSDHSRTNKIDSILLYDARYYNGGVERVVSHLLPMFVNMGLRVYLLTEVENHDKEYSIPEKVTRVHLTHSVDYFDLWCRDIYDFVVENKISLFYCHETIDSRFYYYSRIMHMAGTYIIGHLHTAFPYLVENKKELDSFYIPMYKKADRMIVLSHSDEKRLRSVGIKAKYLPNPIPEVEQNISIDMVYDYERYTILWIGRINQDVKQVLDIPYIFKRVLNKIPNSRLMIVGEADDNSVQKSLNNELKETGINHNTILYGYQKDTSSYYKKAAVLVNTSRYEGFSMIIAESLSYGTPVVMYNLDYLEFVKNHGGIVTVPMGDKDRMADEICKILIDNKYRKRLSEAGKNNVKEVADVNLTNEWANIFNGLLDSGEDS